MFEAFKEATIGYQALNLHDDGAVRSVLSPENFATARAEITTWDGYSPTPLVQLDALSKSVGVSGIYYKDEGQRFGLGSFKALGGAYAGLRVLARELARQLGHEVTLEDIHSGRYATQVSDITLCSATDGNHGKSLAWGAQRFGCKCKIYIHAEVSEGRAKALRQYGADVIRVEGDYDDSVNIAREQANEHGWFVVSDTSWEGYTEPPRDVMAGYGVLVDEIATQIDAPPTHVFVQGGVGGLAAAVFARLSQIYGDDAPRMIVVEPELAACLFASAKVGTPRSVNIEEETWMGGLSCGEPSEMAWQVLRETASDFVTVPESLVKPSLKILAEPLGGDAPIAAGESAIAGLAALLAIMQNTKRATALGLSEQSRVLLIGSEGITDSETYAAVMDA